MKRIPILGATMLALLLAGACGERVEEEPFPMDAPTATLPATPSAPSPGATALGVDSLAGVGPYLTDAGGRALYLLEGEPQNESTCYDACAEAWPPLLANGVSPAAGAASVQGNLIGTLQRRDGTTQVTYDGHALYYYQGDQTPGQTTGHDLTDQWGEWYLVSPTGEALEGEEAGSR